MSRFAIAIAILDDLVSFAEFLEGLPGVPEGPDNHRLAVALTRVLGLPEDDWPCWDRRVQDAISGSLNACRIIHDRLLPGWRWAREQIEPDGPPIRYTLDTAGPPFVTCHGEARDDGLAWCAAICRGLAARAPSSRTR